MNKTKTIAAVGLGILCGTASGQEFMMIDGSGGLYRGEVGIEDLVRLGTAEGGQAARTGTFLTDERFLYAGGGLTGHLWYTDTEHFRTGLYGELGTDLVFGELPAQTMSVLADGEGLLYIQYLGLNPPGPIFFPSRFAIIDEHTQAVVHDTAVTEGGEQVSIVLLLSMAILDSGDLICITDDDEAVTMDIETGELTPAPDPDYGAASVSEINTRVARLGDQFYMVVSGLGAVELLLYEPATGALEPVQMWYVDQPIFGFAFIQGSPADHAPPYGEVDFQDAIGFVGDLTGGEMSADLAPPRFTLDYRDVIEFLEEFVEAAD